MIHLLYSIFTNSLNITFFIFLLLLLEPFLKKHFSAVCLYRIWVMLLIGLLLPVRFEVSKALFYISLPRMTVEDKTYGFNKPVNQESGDIYDTINTPQKQTGTGIWNTNSDNFQGKSTSFLKPVLIPILLLIFQYRYLLLCQIWLIGAAFLLIKKGIRYYRFTKLLMRFRQPVSPKVREQEIEHCIQSLDKNHGKFNHGRLSKYSKTNIFKCAIISSPMTVGIFKPVILLPEESYPDKDLHFIIQHELVHIYRKDSFVKLIRLIVLVLNWYNPFCYILAKHLDSWCEISCDEIVLREATKSDCLYYGKLLLKSAEALPRQNTVTLMNLYGGKNNMKHRLAFILDHRKKHSGKLLLVLALSLIFTTVIVAAGNQKDVLASDKNVKITDDSAAVQSSEKETNQMDAKDKKPDIVSDADSLRDKVVTDAKQAEGIPYVWGGNDLKTGVDCSGFVQAVYKKAGYDLPRALKEQEKASTQISMDNLLPGDLIFYASSNDNTIKHVGIYIGDNKIIHAKNAKDNVVIADMNYRPPYSAGRIIND